MSDLISRQAAIKATWQDTGYTDPFNVMTAIRDRINALPTIQPKRERMENVELRSGYERGDNMTRDEFMDVVYDELYSDGDNNRANRIIYAADDYVDEYAPHWIPVTERLPEENYLDDGYVEPSQPVLVYMSYRCYKVSRYWGHRKTKGTSDYVIPDWMDLEDHDGDNVLAWMSLPERYSGVAE